MPRKKPPEPPKPPPYDPNQDPLFRGQELEYVPIDTIGPHPRNPNEGDVEAIEMSVDVNGFYSVCFVQRSTKRILAGEHRWKALRGKGGTHVPVVWLDVDDEQAEVIILADNKYAQLAKYNEQRLRDLVSDVQKRQENLLGTGWHDVEYQDLIERSRPPTQEEIDKKHKTPTPEDFWPVIRLLVPEHVKAQFETLMRLSPQTKDHEKFAHILESAQPTIVKEPAPTQ